MSLKINGLLALVTVILVAALGCNAEAPEDDATLGVAGAGQGGVPTPGAPVASATGTIPAPAPGAPPSTPGGGSAPTCSDGLKNGVETGVDCGGSCTPCPPGALTPDAGLPQPPPPAPCGTQGLACCGAATCSGGLTCDGGICKAAARGTCEADCVGQNVQPGQCQCAVKSASCGAGWTPTVTFCECNWLAIPGGASVCTKMACNFGSCPQPYATEKHPVCACL
ncbi:MAG: hypothetical protein IPG50_15235 [Myxococcales bacterium]|nr:hypothetical protein [Myxococcales bacterium]